LAREIVAVVHEKWPPKHRDALADAKVPVRVEPHRPASNILERGGRLDGELLAPEELGEVVSSVVWQPDLFRACLRGQDLSSTGNNTFINSNNTFNSKDVKNSNNTFNSNDIKNINNTFNSNNSSTSQISTVSCSGSEAGSYLRLIDFVYHSTLGVRVLKKKKTMIGVPRRSRRCRLPGRSAGCTAAAHLPKSQPHVNLRS